MNNNLVKLIIKYKLDILIYQLNNIKEIKALNKLKNIKIVFYQHSSLFYELYSNYSSFYNLYKEYQNSKYIVSIIRYEADYLFIKWGIKSILMNNFVTFDYEKIIQSDLSTKIILMIGRANNKLKRFNLGILSMEYIKENIKGCKMRVISNLNGTFFLQSLVNNLDLKDKIEFVGYSVAPEINFKNASLHIFPSIAESFGLVLCETKLYGIPNILVGLNYVSASNGGTIIVYDDSPESIARESIKILKNNNYKGKLGKEAKMSMKKLNNKIEFIGYSVIPEINFKNASLHIFPSISESFGLVLCETKLYGIPNILVGLNYLSASNGGTIIVYDDSPESIARESIKILKNNIYKRKLGKEAKISMKKFNNNLLLKNWIKLILTIYKYHQHYENLRIKTSKMNQNMGINIIKSQIIFLKKRKLEYYNMSINDFLNYSQLKKFLIKK